MFNHSSFYKRKKILRKLKKKKKNSAEFDTVLKYFFAIMKNRFHTCKNICILLNSLDKFSIYFVNLD